MSGHTKLPWRADLSRWSSDSPVAGFAIRSDFRHPSLPDGMAMHSIASLNLYEHSSATACFAAEEIEANAAVIVKAVNSHEPMVAALKAMVERYTELVNCGDCGNWNPETEAEVIAIRAALAAAEASE